MIEIVFLIWYYRHLGTLAAGRNRERNWGWLGVGLWVAGEVVGAVIGSLVTTGAGSYLLALLGGVVGAIIARVVVGNLRVGPTMTLPIVAANSPATTALKTCPGCWRAVSGARDVCPYCGAGLGLT